MQNRKAPTLRQQGGAKNDGGGERMGEVAEMMLDGTLCAGCGTFLGSSNGFPTYCIDCREEQYPLVQQPKPKYPKVVCKICGKKVKKGQGEKDHLRVVHQK